MKDTTPSTETTPLRSRPEDRPAATPSDRGASDAAAAPGDEFREKAFEILRREFPPPGEGPGTGTPSEAREPLPPPGAPAGERPVSSPERGPRPATLPDVIPARMLNEFVYCPRLFYYEFVENVFLESADTLRGAVLHARVDGGKGAMPPTRPRQAADGQAPDAAAVDAAKTPAPVSEPQAAGETIHSRSVQLGSKRLGVTAKLDLVEIRGLPPSGAQGELFGDFEVCPVDYKAGAPREGAEANELWPTDRMQLGLQMLLLRENGYPCREGIIYYRATKQRVPLSWTPELESWIRGQIDEARRVAAGPIPAPLEASPKCVRCSLAPVCLPDETRLLARPAPSDSGNQKSEIQNPKSELAPRRLMASRDDRRALYLNTPGLHVGVRDEVLRVKDREKVIEEIRLRDVCHVALFGNIQISTQAIQSMCELEVPVTYFSMGGWFYGLTRGHELKNVFLRMEQFRLARDEAVCLALAARFVHGKIRNHRTMLMRNHVEPPEPVLLRLRQAATDALRATSLDELLGIEGAAAASYFREFNGMIKVDAETSPTPNSQLPASKPPAFTFHFENRNRRPPTDPVNALLSLAYSMLTKDATLAALAVGFDPYVGFYHQPRFGRPALGLDLVEEFRPLVAESVVLTCLNNRVITEKDFVRAGEAVNLSPAGRKRFLQTYEQRMTSLITHPVFDYKVSYRRALELQARILGRTLTGEIPEYIPLITR